MSTITKERAEEILAPIVESADGRKNIGRPVFKNGWTVATDGWRLLALNGEFADEPNSDFPASPWQWLAEEVKGTPVEASVLLSFLGEPVKIRTTTKCKKCDGMGEIQRSCDHCGDEHDCSCDNCDHGKVTHRAEARQVAIGQAYINALLPAEAFAVLKPEGLVYVNHAGPNERITFSGDGWRLFLMPLNHHTADKKAPQLFPATKQQ